MGLEVVVRPVVLPNIRPAVPRRIAPPDDPTKGLAALSGGGGRVHRHLVKFQRQLFEVRTARETDARQVDSRGSIRRMNPDGTINKNNFIDVERTEESRLDDQDGTRQIIYADPTSRKDNVEVIGDRQDQRFSVRA